MTVTAGQILCRYYELRAKQGGPPKPSYFRKAAWGHADALLAWAGKVGISDPLGYVDFVFRARKYGADNRPGKPQIQQLHRLRSRRLADLFAEEWRANERALETRHEKLRDRAGSKQEQSVKHLRLLTKGQESAKHPYAASGRYDMCLVETDITGGYHPLSKHCPTCPVAVRCVAKLLQQYGYDVRALREGWLHRLPKEIAVAAIK